MLGLFLFPLAVLGAVPHRPGSSWTHTPSVGEPVNVTTTEITTTKHPTVPLANCSSTEESPALTTTTAPYGSPVKPKVLFIANTFEFGYLTGYNFTTRYTGPLLNSTFACTADGETCKFARGQELVSAAQLTALLLVPGIDLSQTYIFVTGTGGVNPKYGTAGGVAISRFSVQWEWGGMFLGADLPSNFSGQYFFAYGQDTPDKYPSLVGTEVYELNEALVERFYASSRNLTFEDVTSDGRKLRESYSFPAAKRAPFLAKCDVVSSQTYWHGSVAGENVEHYADVVTSGAAKPCNANQDDQGRFVALVNGAVHGRLDFGRVALIKAFSNFDRPPPPLTAFQSRYEVGEGATGPGLVNAWRVVGAAAADVVANWDGAFAAGVAAGNYVGDAKGNPTGRVPPFVRESSAVDGSLQGS